MRNKKVLAAALLVCATSVHAADVSPSLVFEQASRFPDASEVSSGHTLRGSVGLGRDKVQLTVVWSVVKTSDGCHRIGEVKVTRSLEPKSLKVLSPGIVFWPEDCATEWESKDKARYELGIFRANIVGNADGKVFSHSGSLADINGKGRGRWIDPLR